MLSRKKKLNQFGYIPLCLAATVNFSLHKCNCCSHCAELAKEVEIDGKGEVWNGLDQSSGRENRMI